MISTPRVSIVIPVYNGSNYLCESINSALNQTYPNIEVIVVNDGSSDNGATENIALSFGTKIRYLSKKNGGVASALNTGIKIMSGEYFSWLSHDDVYYPHKIYSQINYINKFAASNKVILYSDYDVIDSHSRIQTKKALKAYLPEEFRQALILDNPIHGCSILVPRNLFDDVGLFNENLNTTQDYDMWFRMAEYFDFVYMPTPLIQVREHEMQGTITMTTLHFSECNEFLSDGMKKIEQELNRKYGPYISISFAGKCIFSFSSRCFYKAYKTAILYCFITIIKNITTLGLTSIKLMCKLVKINIFCLVNIFSTYVYKKCKSINNGDLNAR